MGWESRLLSKLSSPEVGEKCSEWGMETKQHLRLPWGQNAGGGGLSSKLLVSKSFKQSEKPGVLK